MPSTMPIEGDSAYIDCTEENWDKTIAINLKGIWLCMQHEILEMLKQVKVPSSTALGSWTCWF
jgi:NAD(P)-dependent dehydrogenase (short-subunit alcohol dehydrogenase family)